MTHGLPMRLDLTEEQQETHDLETAALLLSVQNKEWLLSVTEAAHIIAQTALDTPLMVDTARARTAPQVSKPDSDISEPAPSRLRQIWNWIVGGQP